MKRPISLLTAFFILSIIGSHFTNPAFAENRTLTLEEAIRLAMAHSPDALIAGAEARQAEEALRETRSYNLPRAVIGSGAAYNKGLPMNNEGGAPSIFRIDANQPVLNIQNRNLIREASESAKAARIGSDIAGNELAARTAIIYYRLDQARKIAVFAESRLGEANKQQEWAKIDIETGRGRPIDVKIAEGSIAGARQQLLTAKEQARVAEAELRELVRFNDTISINTITPPMESPIFNMEADALFEKTAASSPEILQAEAKILAKEYAVAAAKAEQYPQLDAIGSYGMLSRSNNYEDYYKRFERNTYLIGISAQFPLFDGNRAKARVARSREEQSIERLNLNSLKSNLKLNIEKGLSAVRIARGAVDVTVIDLEIAEEIVGTSEILLESGRIGEREMADLRLQVRQKELAKLEAEHELFLRKIELLRVTGSILTVF